MLLDEVVEVVEVEWIDVVLVLVLDEEEVVVLDDVEDVEWIDVVVLDDVVVGIDDVLDDDEIVEVELVTAVGIVVGIVVPTVTGVFEMGAATAKVSGLAPLQLSI